MEWSCPGPCINCDAAIEKNYSVITAARDWRGGLVFALSKKANTNVPLQAEAEALLWFVQLVGSFTGIKVVIKGDSKMCIEALRTRNLDVPWRISSCLTEICRLTSLLSDCSFIWVRREANRAVHELATWSLQNHLTGSFDFGAGPPSLANILLDDSCRANVYSFPNFRPQL